MNHSSEEPVKATFYSVYTCTWYVIGYYQLDLKAKNSSQNMSLGTERLKVRYRRYMDTCYDHGGKYSVPSDTESQIEINYVLLPQKGDN